MVNSLTKHSKTGTVCLRKGRILTCPNPCPWHEPYTLGISNTPWARVMWKTLINHWIGIEKKSLWARPLTHAHIKHSTFSCQPLTAQNTHSTLTQQLFVIYRIAMRRQPPSPTLRSSLNREWNDNKFGPIRLVPTFSYTTAAKEVSLF
jgi:hypothetical protein